MNDNHYSPIASKKAIYARVFKKFSRLNHLLNVEITSGSDKNNIWKPYGEFWCRFIDFKTKKTLHLNQIKMISQSAIMIRACDAEIIMGGMPCIRLCIAENRFFNIEDVIFDGDYQFNYAILKIKELAIV